MEKFTCQPTVRMTSKGLICEDIKILNSNLKVTLDKNKTIIVNDKEDGTVEFLVPLKDYHSS